MTGFNFDVVNTEPASLPPPIKDGWYAMLITAAAFKHSDKAGRMTAVTFEVDGSKHPEFARRKVFANFCAEHPTNDTTRGIAQGHISAILHSIGKAFAGAGPDDMVGGELQVSVIAVPAKDGYPAKNEAKGFRRIDGSEAKKGSAASTAAKAAAAPAAKAAPAAPWKK